MDDLKKGYKLSDLLKGRGRLASLVGDIMADKWISDRYNRSVSYGFPQYIGEDGKRHNTAYGVLRNLDAYPERYIKEDIPVTVVPDEQWKGIHGGEFSWLGGVRMPESRRLQSHPQENVMTHEQQHYVDAVISSRNKQNQYSYDTNLMRGIANKKNLIDSPANTGRGDIWELLPEILDYESRLPAGKGITSTDFWKGLTSDQQALIIRKLQPMPEGVDAMTGVVR